MSFSNAPEYSKEVADAFSADIKTGLEKLKDEIRAKFPQIPEEYIWAEIIYDSTLERRKLR